MERPEEVEEKPEVSWERSWSLDEMHGAAGEWTLASDAGLLFHLKDFSVQLMNKTRYGKEGELWVGFVCLFVCLFIYLFVYLFICLFVWEVWGV